MADPPLTVISCSVFRPELSALADRGRLAFPVRFLDSSLHMRPEKLHARLRRMVRQERRQGNLVLLVYGDCSAFMSELGEEEGVLRTTGLNCGELLLGKERHRTLRKERAFLLFPEWVKRWRTILLKLPGLDEETTRLMMRDMHTRFVYLDTGAAPVPEEALRACGGHFGLPVEVCETGLDHLLLRLTEAARRLQDRHGKTPAGAGASEVLRPESGRGEDAGGGRAGP